MTTLPALWVLQVGEQRWFTEADCQIPPCIGMLAYLQPGWAFRVDEIRTGSLDVWANFLISCIMVMRIPASPEWVEFMNNAEGWEVFDVRHPASKFLG